MTTQQDAVEPPRHTCPVCFYPGLHRPPADHFICPCCGTQFEYHDSARTHEELRERWITNGMQWHSRALAAPEGWDARRQLERGQP
jgi:ribosomal protein L37AE/L43A